MTGGYRAGRVSFKLIWQCFKERFPVDLFPDQNICSHKIIKIVYMQANSACGELTIMLANSVYYYPGRSGRRNGNKHRDS